MADSTWTVWVVSPIFSSIGWELTALCAPAGTDRRTSEATSAKGTEFMGTVGFGGEVRGAVSPGRSTRAVARALSMEKAGGLTGSRISGIEPRVPREELSAALPGWPAHAGSTAAGGPRQVGLDALGALRRGRWPGAEPGHRRGSDVRNGTIEPERCPTDGTA